MAFMHRNMVISISFLKIMLCLACVALKLCIHNGIL